MYRVHAADIIVHVKHLTISLIANMRKSIKKPN